MLHEASRLSGYLRKAQSMEDYMKESSMQSLRVWATEAEIIGAAHMLATTIYTYAPYGSSHKWLKFEPAQHTRESCDTHRHEAIYLSNTNNHFEPVDKHSIHAFYWFKVVVCV